MANLPWLRLYTDTVDNEKIRLLEFSDRWHYIALLCLKQQGVLDSSENLLDRKLSVKLGLPIDELPELKKRLIEIELIDENWLPIGWDNKQFPSDSSTERTRKYRKNQKKKVKEQSEASQERHSDLTDIDADADKDIEQNKDNSENTSATRKRVPFTEIINLYHEVLSDLPRVAVVSNARKGHIRQRWNNQLPDMDAWKRYFEHIKSSNWLMGKVPPSAGRRQFIADIDYVINESNLTKIIEGKYHDE